jgi:hypothetical protein
MYPAIVEELDQLIEEHLKDAAAVLPLPNPEFDPSQYRPEEIGVQIDGLKDRSKNRLPII